MSPARRTLGTPLLGLTPFVVAALVLTWTDATKDNATQAAHSLSARECAIRTVYYHAQDDWGQRALLASSVLNQAPAPSAAISCSANPITAEHGTRGIPNAYRLQSAIDAVDAVISGSYALPSACIGVTSFMSAKDAPNNARCIYDGIAFLGEHK